MAPARFFTNPHSSPLGRAALISVLAMVAMNLAVLDRNTAGSAVRPHIVATAAAVTGELA